MILNRSAALSSFLCQIPTLRSLRYMTSLETSVLRPSSERQQELKEALNNIRRRLDNASAEGSVPTLIAVSKYKPAADILACYEQSQRDFGESYIQELADKASVLPHEIRWHFIGALQSNKAKILASIPNLYCVQTIASVKAATALNKAIPVERIHPLRVLIQVNTSGEATKSGVPCVSSGVDVAESELGQLAAHIVKECPKLWLEGLMTIGALEQSLHASETEKNADFEKLRETRNRLGEYLAKEDADSQWGHETTRTLVLSMGMSQDFEAALKAGSNIVRVGTGIFGQRSKTVM